MKRRIALLLVFALAYSLMGCGGGERAVQEPEEEEPIAVTGGWAMADTPELTDHRREIAEQGIAQLAGMDGTPLAYVASESGEATDHCILCALTSEEPDIPDELALLICREQGEKVEVLQIMAAGAEVPEAGLAGGWTMAESPVVTDEVADLFFKATSGFTEDSFLPIALVSTQVVAGTNYCILACNETDAAEEVTDYALFYIYQDLQGNVEVSDIAYFLANEG